MFSLLVQDKHRQSNKKIGKQEKQGQIRTSVGIQSSSSVHLHHILLLLYYPTERPQKCNVIQNTCLWSTWKHTPQLKISGSGIPVMRLKSTYPHHHLYKPLSPVKCSMLYDLSKEHICMNVINYGSKTSVVTQNYHLSKSRNMVKNYPKHICSSNRGLSLQF